MPKKKLDDVTRKKLLYAKQFYMHGEEHARQQNPVDRMIAIHQFHAAIEIVIKAIFSQLFPDEKIGFVQFNTIVKKICPKCPWITDSRVEFLKRLNERRNDVQHTAEVLATEHMPEYQFKSKDFLEDCLNQHFGVKFDELDLVDSISDKKLRQVLLWAGELIELKDYESSIAFSKLAHEIAFKDVCKKLTPFYGMGINLRDEIYVDLDQSLPYEDLENFKDAVSSGFSAVINRVEETVALLLSIGRTGGLHNYYRLSFIHPAIYLEGDGNVKLQDVGVFEEEPKSQKGDALTVRDYAINCIIAWQDLDIRLRWHGYQQLYFEWAKSQIEAKRKEAAK